MSSAAPPGGPLDAEARANRVHAILRAARRLADEHDALGQEARALLPEATGLSRAGIELGLRRHMETHVSPFDLERFILRAGSASHVHVLLSANVFVGAIRAVALAVAAAPAVSVRASRRENVMPSLLYRALDRSLFELVPELSLFAGDEVHVYGRDETVSAVAAQSPPGVRIRGYGAGFGVAWVSGKGARCGDAASLSWDVIAFDQRGCVSPRVVLFEGEPADAERFAEDLAAELARRESEVPRGELSGDEREGSVRYARTLQAVGHAYVGSSYVVGLDVAPRALVLPPPGRHVHIARVSSGTELQSLAGRWSTAITCVGFADDGRPREAQFLTSVAQALYAVAPKARWQPLGSMQTPPLDGPVDLRGVL